jgi:predicted dehydrogenase
MTVEVGIVGLGNIGRMHAYHLVERGADWGCELVGGMDVAGEARERFEDSHDAPAFADAGTLYERCDAVLVTTPNRFHEEYATGALAAGLDVLLEKPLAHTLESAERIAAAAAEAEGFCMTGFQSRFAPAVEVLRGYQEEGRLGETYHVEANYLRRRGIPGLGSWFTDRGLAGGGALIDVGVHPLDLGLWFLGFPEVREVSGTARSQFGGRDDYTYLRMWGEDGDGAFDVDDSVTALVRCAGGRTLSLEVAWAANRDPDHDVVVRGTGGGATVDPTTGDLRFHESAMVGDDHHADTEVETRDADAHVREKCRFVEAVRTGEPPERNTVEQALTVQRVVDAIYRSSEAGRAVEVPGESDSGE